MASRTQRSAATQFFTETNHETNTKRMMNYGLGGQEKKGDDANEAISDIQKNRTMLVQKLTANAPFRPAIEEKLETIDAVFARFKPEIELEFQDSEGADVAEKLRFDSLTDFGKKGITTKSPFLQTLNS